jgi:bla regulator protein blaR1
MTAVADHLWQSTLVAGGAAVLALLLRNNRAHLRHAVWLAASLKFLIPFAALIAIGRRLGIAPPAAAYPAVDAPLHVVVGTVARPFSMRPIDGPVAAAPAGADWVGALSFILAALWIAGALTVLSTWIVRWLRVARLVSHASPLENERVLTPLRRLARRGRSVAIRTVSADTRLEPGVFGIFRPVLLWPRGITDKLADDHIEAILAHELCHLERRDNFWAAAHGAVQALFWFHPLVWWIGARLIDERERACDESVVASGRDPERYAESILETCRHSLEGQAWCMAGVTGANLDKRIEHIMSGRPIGSMPWWKTSIMAAAGTAAIGGPIAVGLSIGPLVRAQVQQAPGDRPSFEVASVKPNTSAGPNQIRVGMPGNGRFNINNMPLAELIRFAYELQPFQLTGGPDWINSQRFDVTATTGGQSGPPLVRQMLQSLLAERFNLAVHTETRDMAIYEMVLARGDRRLGEKMRVAGPDCAPLTMPPGMPPPPPPPAGAARGTLPPGAPGCPTVFGNGFLSARRTSMEQLARNLSRTVRRIVVDKTGMSGFYDMDLEFMPDGPLPPQAPGAPQFPNPNPDAPSIYTALQEQLGLKLESARGPVETMVIDRVEALVPD